MTKSSKTGSQKPWEKLGMSRATFYRRKNNAASVSDIETISGETIETGSEPQCEMEPENDRIATDKHRERGGRPTDYKPEFDEQAKKLCEHGFTDLELADFFGVAKSTLYLWIAKYPQFSDSIKTGKQEPDERVERSLYNRAVGYEFETEKIFNYQGQIVRAKTREHVPPDTAAAFIWLKNRRKDRWRDKHEVESTVTHIDRMGLDELKAYVEREATELGVGDAALAPARGSRTSH